MHALLSGVLNSFLERRKKHLLPAHRLLDQPGDDGAPVVDGRRRRIALYSHDTMGLGHMRRNLLIAHALASTSTPADILLVTGASQVNAFALPPAVDCLSLPALQKGDDGRYSARRLDLSLRDLINLRASTIRAALLAFQPDVFIVDNVPRGATRELDPTLCALRATGRTRIVLGLRDVLDEPGVVAREWNHAENFSALRDHYDAVWVYGDPKVYDASREYNFPSEIAAKIRYTGYLDGRLRPSFSIAESDAALADLCLPPGRMALCLVGGGQDGADVAAAFVQATFPSDMNAVVVTGPYVPAEVQQQLRLAAETNPRLRVLGFLPEPTLLLNRAERVIAMGGYNTVCEVLAFEKPTLLAPRVEPRQEQWIRAERLRRLGLVDVLHPDSIGPDAFSGWLASDRRPLHSARGLLDLNGLSRLPRYLQDVLAAPARPSRAQNQQLEDRHAHIA